MSKLRQSVTPEIIPIYEGQTNDPPINIITQVLDLSEKVNKNLTGGEEKGKITFRLKEC